MFSNIGLAVNIHYCKDVVANVSYDFISDAKIYSIQQIDNMACCHEQPNEAETCCKDQVVKQKTDNQQQITAKTVQFQFDSYLVPTIYEIQLPEVFELKIPKNTFVQFYCESNAPPLYKLYRKLVFYA